MKQDAEKAIDLLVENECLISRLYGIYADAFPESRSFWRGLAEDEQEHARMLRSLRGGLTEEAEQGDAGYIDPTSVKMFQDYLRVLVASGAGKSLTVDQAFETAARLELDLLERRFFESLRTNSEEMEETRSRLIEQTKEHRARLQQALERKRTS